MDKGSYEGKMSKLNIIDLFCGAGGLSYGFQEAGFNVLLGIDNDKAAVNTFKKNHNGSRVICGDITQITYSKDIKPLISDEEIDVIVGGPPCQGFSLSGPRNFDDPRNKLYLSYVRLVKEIQPKAFIIENVPGLVRLFNGQVKDNIIKQFNLLGYDVQYKILCAADYGVSQNRRRVVFVGKKKSIKKNFSYPEPHEDKVSCEMALSDLPPLEDYTGSEVQSYRAEAKNSYQRKMRLNSKELYNHVSAQHAQRVKDIISMVPDGGNYKDLPEHLRKNNKFHVAWTRFCSSKPAPTIDTGHRHHFHYKYNRVPTVRECARIQSFPDSFHFVGNKTQQFRQVGNAVPPLMAKAIADELKKILMDNNDD